MSFAIRAARKMSVGRNILDIFTIVPAGKKKKKKKGYLYLSPHPQNPRVFSRAIAILKTG